MYSILPNRSVNYLENIHKILPENKKQNYKLLHFCKKKIGSAKNYLNKNKITTIVVVSK